MPSTTVATRECVWPLTIASIGSCDRAREVDDRAAALARRDRPPALAARGAAGIVSRRRGRSTRRCARRRSPRRAPRARSARARASTTGAASESKRSPRTLSAFVVRRRARVGAGPTMPMRSPPRTTIVSSRDPGRTRAVRRAHVRAEHAVRQLAHARAQRVDASSRTRGCPSAAAATSSSVQERAPSDGRTRGSTPACPGTRRRRRRGRSRTPAARHSRARRARCAAASAPTPPRTTPFASARRLERAVEVVHREDAQRRRERAARRRIGAASLRTRIAPVSARRSATASRRWRGRSSPRIAA